MQLISRRSWCQQCAAVIASCAVGPVRAWSGESVAADDVPVRLFREIKHASLYDVSPDSTKLCLYFTRHPWVSYSWHGGWHETSGPVRDGEDGWRIVSTESWKSVYATRIPSLPSLGSFFADSEAVYVETVVHGGGTLHVVSDLRTGKKDEHLEPYSRTALFFSYWALQDRQLLGAGTNPKTNRNDVLVRAAWPSYDEIQRVAFAGERHATRNPPETPVTVSADRKRFVYGAEDTIYCRRTEDLEIVWTRRPGLQPDMDLLRTGISADGSMVAVAASDMLWTTVKKQRQVCVYDGKDGAELIRLPVDGTEGVAISPDKRLLAAGQLIQNQGKRSETQPTVILFDLASGKKLATLVQDRFRGRHQYLSAGFNPHGIQFTPNGKYLITSGQNTKIWEVESIVPR